jgi:capsular polysaccharide biosynthesis protein
VAIKSILAVFERRRLVFFIALAVALVALPFIMVFLKPTYVGTSHIMMIGNASGGATGAIMPSTDMANLTVSEPVVRRVANRLSLGANLSTVSSHLDAKVSLHSNVMPISFRSKDHKVAIAASNAFAEETVRYYKELSGGQYDQMIAYLTQAANREREKIRSADQALQLAAQRDTYVGSDTALEAITTRINELETLRATAYATLVSDEAIAQAQSAQPAEIAGIVRQEVLNSDPYVQALRLGQAKDAAQLDFQRAQFTDRFPGIPGLQEQVRGEAQTLQSAEKAAVSGSLSASTSYAATTLAKRNALAVAAGDQAKVKAIDSQITVEKGHLRDLPGTGATVNLLRAERESAKAAYGATILRLTDTRANQAAASSLASLVVIDRAIDAAPRIPRFAMDLLVALILLALSIGIAYAVDVLDPALRSPDAIEKLYGLPIISHLGGKR